MHACNRMILRCCRKRCLIQIHITQQKTHISSPTHMPNQGSKQLAGCMAGNKGVQITAIWVFKKHSIRSTISKHAHLCQGSARPGAGATLQGHAVQPQWTALAAPRDHQKSPTPAHATALQHFLQGYAASGVSIFSTAVLYQGYLELGD